MSGKNRLLFYNFMKLHLPSSLRKALLACLAAFALPVSLPVTIGSGAILSILAAQHAEATSGLTPDTTTYEGITYGGKIYTLSGDTIFHQSTFTQFLPADGGAGGSYSGIIGTDRYNDEGISTPSFTFWQNLFGSGNAAGGSGSRYGHTIRFANSRNTISYEFQFTPIHIGGIITAAGNSGEYIFYGGNNSTRNILLESVSGTVHFTLKSSLQINCAATAVQTANYASDAMWHLASGKTLTWNNYNVVTAAGKSLHVLRLDEVQEENDTEAHVYIDKNLTIGNEGTFTLGKGVVFTLNGTLNAASTEISGGNLVLRNVTSSNAIRIINNGALTFSNDLTVDANFARVTIEEGSLVFDGETTINSLETLDLRRDSVIAFNSRANINRENYILTNTYNARQGSTVFFNCSTTIEDGGKLLIDDGGTIIFNGPTTINTTALDAISLKKGATLEFHTEWDGLGEPPVVAELREGSRINLDGGRLVISDGVFDASAGTISYHDGDSITIDTTTGGLLKVGEDTLKPANRTGSLNIILILESYESGIHKVFTDDSVFGTEQNIVFDTRNYARGINLERYQNVYVSITGEYRPADIVWNGSDAGTTWANGLSGWETEDNDKTFHPEDNVTFTGSDSITIDGAVTTGQMYVQGNYLFTGGNLTVQNEEYGLVISENASATFEGVNITAPSIEVEQAAQLVLSGSDISVEGGLHVSQGAKVTVAGDGIKYFAEDEGNPGVTIEENATLRIENDSNWRGYVQGEGTLELATGGLHSGRVLFQDDGSINSLSDGYVGKLLREETINKVTLTDDTLLQITQGATSGRFNLIQHLEVTAGSVFAWRAAGTLGTEDSLLTLAGEGALSNDSASYAGALQIGVFLGDPNKANTFVLNSKVELSDDATVYVYGQEGGALQTGEFTNVLTSNGHTLKKTGLGTLTFNGDFHADPTQHGRIEVQEGLLRLSYSSESGLAKHDIYVHGEHIQELVEDESSENDVYTTKFEHATLELSGEAQVSSYTIGAISGNGVISKGTKAKSLELRFVNTYQEKTLNNTFSGEFDTSIIMHVMGGYQAFERDPEGENLTGELTMIASHGGTLDVAYLPMAEGEGNALHLIAGTQGTEATDDQEAVAGTAGILKLNGYHLPAGAAIDVTLCSGSLLDMSGASIAGDPPYTREIPHLDISATASEVNLSALQIGLYYDDNEPGDATSTWISITLDEGSTLNMVDSTLNRYAELELQLNAAASTVNMAHFTANGGFTLSAQGGEDEEGNTLPGLTDGTELNLSNSSLGNNATIDITAAQSTINLSSTVYGEQAKLTLNLTDGSTANLSHIELGREGFITIIAEGCDVNLAGAKLDIIPPTIIEENPGKGELKLELTGGTHNLSNISFGEDMMFNMILREDAWANLTDTTPARGLQIMVEDTKAVLENMQVGVGSRVEATDGILTLAGKNIIHLDPELDKAENRIFSDLELRLMEGAKLSVDATNILPIVLADVGKSRTYYIADGDLTAWSNKLSFGAELALLNVMVTLGTDGSLTFCAQEVNADTIYLASRDNQGKSKSEWGYQGDIYSSTDDKVAVYLDCETHIDLRGYNRGLKEDGLVLKNLMGSKEGHLFVLGDGTGESMVTVGNSFSDVSLTEMEQAIDIKVDHEKITFNGNITIHGADLQFHHLDGDTGTASANSTTLLKGVMQITNGELIMTSGKLELAADGNDLGDVGIRFAGHDGQLVINADTKVGGNIVATDNGKLETTRQEHIYLGNESATLTLKNGVHISSGVTIGNLFEVEADDSEEEESEIISGKELPEDEDDLLDQPTEAPRVPLMAGTVSTATGGAQQIEQGALLRNVVLNLEKGSTLTIVGTDDQDAPLDPPEADVETPLDPPAAEDEAALAAALLAEDEGNELAPLPDESLTDNEQPELQVQTDWALAGITGEGKLVSASEHQGGIEICTAGGDKHFSGDLKDYNGTMVVYAGSDTQFFDGVTGGKGWNLVNTAGGHVEFNLMGGSQPGDLTMGDLTLQEGSYTTLRFNMEPLTNGIDRTVYLRLKSLTIEDGADVTLAHYAGTISLPGGGEQTFFLGTIDVENSELNIGENVIWHLQGIRNAKVSKVYVNNGGLYMEGTIDPTNRYAAYTTSHNATVGAGLMWNISNAYGVGGDIAAIDALLTELLLDNEKPTAKDIATANHVMAALAGPSTAVLGDAVRTDMERQLRTIRNRTTTLAYSGDEYARKHSAVWLNGEGNYYKQNADGTMPGYKVTGWGGTVGAHTQVSENTTVGLALTAMYNDLESDGPDMLKGDMDTYYLTAFAQVAHAAWRHTFVMSIGKADLDANRTVNYGTGSYTTKDSTDALSFGVLYEVGYTMPLNIDYSVCLQPVFNVAWRVGQVGAYTETSASNAGLRVDEQTYNAITFGAGARLQAAFGSNIWNRTGLLETRALLKVDVGDRQGESTVSLIQGGNFRDKVKSAEMGAVGIELGAGITLPTGRRGEAFADFSAELRADYTNLNATVGYKVSF